MSDANKLLQQTLDLITEQIAHIKAESKSGKLDHETALDLVRYAGVLDDIAKKKQKDDEQDKKNLSKLSTEELIQKYEEMKNK